MDVNVSITCSIVMAVIESYRYFGVPNASKVVVVVQAGRYLNDVILNLVSMDESVL